MGRCGPLAVILVHLRVQVVVVMRRVHVGARWGASDPE